MRNVMQFLHSARDDEKSMDEAQYLLNELRLKNKNTKEELLEAIRSNEFLTKLFVRPIEACIRSMEKTVFDAELSADDLKAHALARKILVRIFEELYTPKKKEEPKK